MDVLHGVSQAVRWSLRTGNLGEDHLLGSVERSSVSAPQQLGMWRRWNGPGVQVVSSKLEGKNTPLYKQELSETQVFLTNPGLFSISTTSVFLGECHHALPQQHLTQY